ncbi:MAG: hypothetical protein LBD42_08300 [Desulfovibrio sp.]|jgi:hypothetical protein|nr:hypothetical protein [Desulfovibrio sp.]
MLLTEDEAKEKACCKIMPHKQSGGLVTAACLASGCMAWRFVPIAQIHGEIRIDTPRGYCGLAGRPE